MKVWSRCAVATFVILTNKIYEKGEKQCALLVFVGLIFGTICVQMTFMAPVPQFSNKFVELVSADDRLNENSVREIDTPGLQIRFVFLNLLIVNFPNLTP